MNPCDKLTRLQKGICDGSNVKVTPEIRRDAVLGWYRRGELSREDLEHLGVDHENLHQLSTVTPPPGDKKRQPPPRDCQHLGEVKEVRDCPSCGNSTIQIRVYRCGIHGECTKFQSPLGKKFCRSMTGRQCRDYLAADASPARGERHCGDQSSGKEPRQQ